MSSSFWATINLSPRESRKYSKVARKISVLDEDTENDPYLKKVFESSRYTIDFKRKLVFHMAALKQNRMWGYANFTGKDLFELIHCITASGSYAATNEDVDLLLANSDFLLFRDPEVDLLKIFLLRTTGEYWRKPAIKDYAISRIIENNLMTSKIAEMVFSINQAISNTPDSYSSHMPIAEPLKMRFIDEAPVIAWARKKYDFDVSIPDSWVVNFIMPENGLTLNFEEMASL